MGRAVRNPLVQFGTVAGLGIGAGLGLSSIHNRTGELGRQHQRSMIQRQANRDTTLGRRLQRAQVLHSGAPDNMATPTFVYNPAPGPNPNRAYHPQAPTLEPRSAGAAAGSHAADRAQQLAAMMATPGS